MQNELAARSAGSLPFSALSRGSREVDLPTEDREEKHDAVAEEEPAVLDEEDLELTVVLVARLRSVVHFR